MKFATKSIRHDPPHLRHGAKLSREIKNRNFLQVIITTVYLCLYTTTVNSLLAALQRFHFCTVCFLFAIHRFVNFPVQKFLEIFEKAGIYNAHNFHSNLPILLGAVLKTSYIF